MAIVGRIHPSDLPPGVVEAVKRCVKTAAAVDTAQARFRPNMGWNEEQCCGDAVSRASRADDQSTHELGAAVWEWLRDAGVIAEIEKEREDAAE